MSFRVQPKPVKIMKKRGILKMVAYALQGIMVVIACGCPLVDDEEFIPHPNNQFGADGITVTSAGGIIQTLGGDVILNFRLMPLLNRPDSLLQSLWKGKIMRPSVPRVCRPGAACILIEPYMVFHKRSWSVSNTMAAFVIGLSSMRRCILQRTYGR